MAHTKASTIRELTDDNLKAKVSDLREELFNLRFQQRVGQIENPLKLRSGRRELARVKTIIRERQQKVQSKKAEAK